MALRNFPVNKMLYHQGGVRIYQKVIITKDFTGLNEAALLPTKNADRTQIVFDHV